MVPGSPTKNDRIERHLMRQRGAGARTITASFNFSFGLPLVTGISTETPPESTGRQSTSIHTLTEGAAEMRESQESKFISKEPQAEVIRSKTDKSRVKRSHDESSKEAYVADEVDSRSKRERPKAISKRQRKTMSAQRPEDENVAGLSPTQPFARSRPKRRAAATAIARVAEGFAEEAIPIDSKMQPPADGKVRGSRQKRIEKIIVSRDANEMTNRGRVIRINGTKEGTHLPTGTIVASPSLSQSGRRDSPRDEPLHAGKMVKSRRKDTGDSKNEVLNADSEDQRIPLTRQPLAEANVNNIIYASSPEKLSKSPALQISGLHRTPPSHLRQKAGAALTSKTSPVKRRRERLQVVHAEESVLESNPLADDSTSSTKPKHKIETRELINPQTNRKRSMESNQPRPRHAKRRRKRDDGQTALQLPSEADEEPKPRCPDTRASIHGGLRTQPEDDIEMKNDPAYNDGNNLSAKKIPEVYGSTGSTKSTTATKGLSKQKEHYTKLHVSSDAEADNKSVTGQDFHPRATSDADDKKKAAKKSGVPFSDIMSSRKPRPATRQGARTVLEKMPKMNLDDLLSNIASLAQGATSLTTGPAGRSQATTRRKG